MKSRRAPWIGGALLMAFAAVWLWTPDGEREEIGRDAPHEAATSGEPTRADGLHASTVLRPAHEVEPSDEELPLLPPEQRDTTLRTVRGPVVGCITVAGLSSKSMDPRMHARLRVGPRKDDGQAGIADFELVHGDAAPEVLSKCLEQALAKVALALPPETEGYVITPPLAGTDAVGQPLSH